MGSASSVRLNAIVVVRSFGINTLSTRIPQHPALPPSLAPSVPGRSNHGVGATLFTTSYQYLLRTFYEHNARTYQAEVLTEESILIPATDENKEMLLNLFAEVLPRGSTNFEEVSNPTL